MTDEPDLDFSPIEEEEEEEDSRLRAVLIRQARTEGVRVAYDTALAICRDPSAPAQARASAIRSLLEVGDLLNAKGREAAPTKDPAAMSADEISAEIVRARAQLVARKAPRSRANVKNNGAFD